MQAAAHASTAELARLSELIDGIYHGATDPSRWQTVVPAIADWLGAPRALLFTPLTTPDADGFYFAHGIPEANLQLWGTRYQPLDIWSTRSAERGLVSEGNVIAGDDIVPFEELATTPFYREFLQQQNIAHMMCGIIFGPTSPQQTSPVVCSLFRPLERGRFTHIDRDRLALLVPHLSRALGVMTRLRDLELKAAASLAALDRLTVGVVLFKASGAVSFANRAARIVLEEEDGLRLRHRHGDSSLGDVVAGHAAAQKALAEAVRSAVSPDIHHTAHFSSAVAVPRPSGRADYLLNFSTLAERNEFGSGTDAPRAIAFITDSAEPVRPDAGLLSQAYGLTRAEIRLVEALAECLTVEEAGERIGVSKNTAKTQLQSIYAKTNTNNRAKLMRLIVSLAQTG